MIPILRRNDISNEGIPFPSPSSAPVTVQETVEIMNPVLMIFKAVLPSWMVTLPEEYMPINASGIHWHMIVPITMTMPLKPSTVMKMESTLSFLPAPREMEMTTLMPIQNPIASADTRFCNGRSEKLQSVPFHWFLRHKNCRQCYRAHWQAWKTPLVKTWIKQAGEQVSPS